MFDRLIRKWAFGDDYLGPIDASEAQRKEQSRWQFGSGVSNLDAVSAHPMRLRVFRSLIRGIHNTFLQDRPSYFVNSALSLDSTTFLPLSSVPS